MPKLSTSTRLTKAQLIARINALEDQVLDKAQIARDIREQQALHYTPELPLVPVSTHKAYYAYVKQARDAAKAAGKKVASYKTFGNWLQSIRDAGGNNMLAS